MHSLVGLSFHLFRVLAVFPTFALALFSATQSFLGRFVPVGRHSAGSWTASFGMSSHFCQLLRRQAAAELGSKLSTVLMLFLDFNLLLG